MTKIAKVLAQDWETLTSQLPVDLDDSAKEYGALQRRRGIQSGADLLRLILIYASLLSLRATAVWGVGLKLCDISRQALEKRILGSTPWLRYLLAVLLQTVVAPLPQGTGLIRRLVLRDASVIARPGSPGTEWRLHLSWCPFTLQPAHMTLTDAHTGEGLADAGLQAGDLVVADRAHGIWPTIQVALTALAYFIIRLTWSNLPLETPEGAPFDLPAWLAQLPAETEVAEVLVVMTNDPERREFRLVVGRLPADKATEARERITREARAKKRQVHPNGCISV